MKKFVFAWFGALLLAAVPTLASVVDPSFNPGSGAGGGIVEQALPQPDDKILICGNFTSFNGQNRAYVARLNSDGSVDSGFYAQPGYWVRHMDLQRDGKIVIGGYFTTIAGLSRHLIARLNADGSLDTSFDPGTGAQDIIAGGIDGNIDPFIFWLAIQPDGKILVTGNFTNYNGSVSMGIARVNPDGSRDTSFDVGSGLNSWGRHILLLSNGQALVSGWFTSYNGQNANRMVRINSDGSPDPTFNPFFGDRTAIYSSAVATDGKIIATGHSLNYDGLFHEEMRRLNPDGTVDASFHAITNDKTESTVIQPDGKIIVAGSFTQADGSPRTSVARFNPDGSVDPTFSVSIDNFVWGTALESDGKLLIAGGFYTVDGYPRSGVARLLTGISGVPSGGGSGTPIADTPPQLAISATSSSSLTISWSDTASTRAGYAIEQKNSGSFSQIATLGSGTRSFSVTALAPSTSYTFRVRASNANGTSIYSSEVTGSTSAVPQPPPSGGSGANSAAFVSADPSTGGSWKGKYGADGYNIFEDSASLPSYVRLTPIGKLDWTWKDSTELPQAPQRATRTDRLAAAWYSPSGYTIDLTFTDAQPHRVAAYFLDWDAMGRRETIEVTDGATGAILDSRMLTSFGNGVYLIWNLSGHEKISVTANFGNAVMSALFFDGGPSSGVGGSTPGANSNSSSALFVGTDSLTKGNWRGVLGREGSMIPSLAAGFPSYAQASITGSTYVWGTWVSDARGLLYPHDSRKRMASCWFGQSVTLNVNFTDTLTHRLAIYLCDWDSNQRAEKIELLDASTGAVLWSQTISNFSGGKYLTWDVKGSVQLRATRSSGVNAVVNGLFFAPAGTQL